MPRSTCKIIYKVFHSHIISIFFYLSPNRTWNFVTKIFRYRSFPIITGHGTEIVLLMKFEILGLVICVIQKYNKSENLPQWIQLNLWVASLKTVRSEDRFSIVLETPSSHFPQNHVDFFSISKTAKLTSHSNYTTLNWGDGVSEN